MTKRIVYIFFCLLLMSCPGKGKTVTSNRPSFSGDSAYAYIAHQMSLGPRVPNSSAHTQCALYLIEKTRAHGGRVELQKGSKTDYMGRQQAIYNVIAHFNENVTGQPILR